MKKIVITSIIILSTAFIIIITAGIIISFKVIKPTTDSINTDLAKKLSRIVIIPDAIPRPSKSLNETSYSWEMETPQKEVTAIHFFFTPSFFKGQDEITATLEAPENSDLSIFNKVMPAVVSDQQTLQSAQDPLKANLSANQEIGYEEIKLGISQKNNQTEKIIWKFKKSKLDGDLQAKYKKLEKYPTPIFKVLYSIPSVAVSLFKN